MSNTLSKFVDGICLIIAIKKVYIKQTVVVFYGGGVMNSEQKMMLVKYLNLDGEVGKFLTGDLFQELNALISMDLCISDENLIPQKRKENKDRAVRIIKDFLKENNEYKEQVDFYFGMYDMIDVFEHLLTGYVFYFSSLSYKYKAIDIFKDARSIVYSSGPALYEVIC